MTNDPTMPELRQLDDVPAARQWFKDAAMQGVSELFPAGNEQVQLEVDGLQWRGNPPDRQHERDATVRDKTLAQSLRGNVRLTDTQTGEVLDEKMTTLARVPYLTDRGVFVYQGNDFAIGNQLSLKPGVYTRTTQSGKLEAPIQSQGGLRAMKVQLDPDSEEFRLQIGQSRLKLYPLLRAAGYDDERLKALWGEEIWRANKTKVDANAKTRIASKITGETDTTELEEKIRVRLGESQIDPGITEKAIGTPHDKVSPELLADITGQLLRLSRGEVDAAARDALYAQRARTPSVQLLERLQKSGPGELQRVLWKLGKNRDLSRLPTGLFNDQVRSLFFGTGLAQPIEEMSPLDPFDKMERLTRTGEGGLSGHGIPDESRLIHNSQLGFIDPVRTPESGSVGIDMRSTIDTYVDRDGELYTEMVDARTGERAKVAAKDLKDLNISFEEFADDPEPFAVVGGGNQRHIPREDVDYFVPGGGAAMLNEFTNLSPMTTGAHQGRALMSGKFVLSALPMVQGEEPLVQSADPRGGTFEETLGRKAGALRSPMSGQVTQVSGEEITVKTDTGETQKLPLYQNQALNRKTSFTQTPQVQPGQRVEEGDLLASSNFTSPAGRLAVGKNLRVGFLPRGETFEDAFALSESAAKKLAIEKLQYEDLEVGDDTTVEKGNFLSTYPEQYGREQLEKIDDSGLIRPGSLVQKGDPLILATRSAASNPYYYQLRKTTPRASDEAIEWNQETEGVVTDAVETKDGVRVLVKTEQPAEHGDKLGGRYGQKGIAAVIPDSEMPRGEDGEPLDLLISPLAIPSRRNPAMVAEAWLGKAAKERGEPYVMPVAGMDGQAFVSDALRELKKLGLKPQETLYDPKRGRDIPNVATGQAYMYRLSHTAKSKSKGRSLAGYTSEGTPTRGGETGGKKLSRQPLTALLAHGAEGVIAESQRLKGAKNTEFWKAFQLGRDIQIPKVPYANQKLFELLRGGGIDVQKAGTQLHIMPLSDAQIEKTSQGEIQNSKMLDRKTMKPVPGGLFSPEITQGPGGSAWSHISLPEPVPNPIMKKPIASLLGIRQKDVRGIIAGEEQIGRRTGGDALRDALGEINVPRRLKYLETHLPEMSKTKRNTAQRELKYLQALDKYDTDPKDLMISKVPVLPPSARPVSELPNLDAPVISDPNYLYKDLIDFTKTFREAQEVLPEDELNQQRGRLYDAVKAVFGLGDPVTRASRQKQLKGVLGAVFSDSPKHSFLVSQVLGKSQDLSGLAVISPNNALGLDEVGLPKHLAWEIYSPLVLRQLAQSGLKPLQAKKELDRKSKRAESALRQVVESRPVIINRAPTLHKFGMLAMKPRLTNKKTMEIPPPIVQGMGADFDGDTSLFHVPVTPGAIRDAEKMLPSRNLLNPRRGLAIHKPSKEILLGIHLGSRTPKGRTREFDSREAMLREFRRGNIDADQKVRILKQG